MNWAFLYDRTRGAFSIGFRLADSEGPGRLDTSYYDLLASEARLASFIAIARGDVPQEHWFRLSRALVSVEGSTTLVSWSGSMFEYLMPLAGPAQPSPDPAREHLPRRRAGADPLRPAARGALGHLGIGLQLRGPPRRLPVQGLRRPRSRDSSEDWPRTWSSHPTRRRWPPSSIPPRPRPTSAASPARVVRGATGSARRSTIPRARPSTPEGEAPPDHARVHRCAGILRPPSGHEPGRARERAARRPDGAPLPLGSSRAGHRAAAAGARAALRPRHPAASRRVHPGRAGDTHALSATVQLAAHALPQRALPVERPVHHDRHQRRGRRELVARASPSRASARTPPAIRAASSSTCVTCGAV